MMLKKGITHLLIIGCILSIGCWMTSCQGTQSTKILHLGHGLPTTHPVHKAMVFMQEKLEEKSEGKLKIKIYSDAQLGPERVLLELVQIGSIAMTKVSAAVMTNFAPEYGVLEMPYLFKDKDHMFTVFEGEIGKEILSKGEQFWLRGLCFYDAGSRSFYTKDKPVETPEDLEGLKIRVQNSQNAVAMVNILGGAATPIPYGELYTALQQGVVDGAENNPPSLYTSRHYEICKYYSMDEHTSVPDILLISTKVWNSLTDQERLWLQEAADESAEAQKKYWADSEEESLQIMRDAGVQITKPDKGPFVEKVEPLVEELKSEKPVVYDLYQKIQAVQ